VNENKILTFDNWKKPDSNVVHTARANPNRAEYNQRVPKQERFEGCFAVKKQIDKLKEICDCAFWLTESMGFGTSVSYSQLKPTRKYGYAEILFDNCLNSVFEADSPTGFGMFKTIFLGADRIDFYRPDFQHVVARLYINNIWVDMNHALKNERDGFLQPNEVNDYWEHIRRNAFADFKNEKNAISAAMESMKYSEYLLNMFQVTDGFQNPVRKNPVDKSMIPTAMQEANVIRDALLSLHYNYGIGTEVTFEIADEEKVSHNRSFISQIRIQNSAFFDTEQKMELLKRCFSECCGFGLIAHGVTGEFVLDFDVKNICRD